MKFDYALGNPPYQETKGGTKNVDIWPDFLKAASTIAIKRCFVHPGRWVIPTKTRERLHREMLINLYAFDYYPKSSDIFGNVSIDGGVSITVFKDNYNGDIKYFINGEDKGTYKDEHKFFSDKFEEEAYIKVFANIQQHMLPYIHGNIGALSAVNLEQAKHLKEKPTNLNYPIRIWTSNASGKGQSKYQWWWIERTEVNVDDELLKTRKVMLDAKGHSLSHGCGNVINNLPQICDKLSTGDNVLWVIPKNDTDRELELIKSLFMTKTARYLMCITQKSLCVRGFENIPDYVELAKLLSDDELFTDEWFYKTFNFSAELINEIETRVSPKTEK